MATFPYEDTTKPKPPSVYGSQTMKSPISRKPMGGTGWEPGFLFGQAAKIRDNVALCANLDQTAFTGEEEALSARPPANSYMTLAPA